MPVDLIRPRPGLKPKTPQSAAGPRIEPPPSEAWATGTIPEATAAAAPPDEPPVERVRSQGLRVAPVASGSVVPRSPNSEVVVLPSTTSPAASSASVWAEPCGAICPAISRDPNPMGRPGSASKSFNRVGTPWQAPSGASPSMRCRAGVGIQRRQGVQRRVQPIASRDRGPQQVHRRRRAGPDHLGLGSGVQVDQHRVVESACSAFMTAPIRE
ncbi:hypothetical protein O4J55_17910 [Paracoccus sp. PXZ]